MSAKTNIEWTDRTWNPVRGFTRVSEGCRNCYAERTAARFSTHADQSGDEDAGVFAGFAKQTPSGPRWTGRVELIPSKLAEPLSWRKPCRVFVNSMSDLFHEALPFEHIAAVFGVMAACPHITFQVLTKRPKRMRDFFVWLTIDLLTDEGEALAGRMGWCHAGQDDWRLPLTNVWLGVSVEDQETADHRIPILLDCPASIRFVSYEPALERVDFTSLPGLPTDDEDVRINAR